MATQPLNDVTASSAQVSASQVSRSHTREVAPHARAERRVAEYLRAQGLTDEARITTLAREITGDEAEVEPPSPGEAVARAQARVERWREGVFGADAANIDPLWLRAFVASHPGAFLADPELARELVRDYGDPCAGKPRAHAHFRDQVFERAHLPRWFGGLLPPLALTLGATALLVRDLSRGGLDALELAWACAFMLLTMLGALGLWTSWLGFPKDKHKPKRSEAPELPRTALLMPIYHEDPECVFASLLAMREALAREPGGEAFEIFVLSDSRSPERAAEEERAFRRVAALSDPRIPVYYRRRSKNERQKAGNLAEFFERFGHRYTYAVILDADSLMRADTLVELVRRMEAAPEVALIQAPLSLHGGRTLFARAQQLATSVHGPVLTRGLARWAGPHGNYYGHNAIVRVKAFLDCCALPTLAGKPPFGGHILSHDFVEAALLCRDGWQVRIAHDLSGSYEELPPTVPEYVARDRRWCQGNFQHLRIAFAAGLKPMSRLYMLVGAFMYLASPLWLLFIVMGAVMTIQHGAPEVTREVGLVLITATCFILLGPRVLGLAATLRDSERKATHGGALKVTASVFVETLFATLLSPILMLHHTRIVASILLGKAIRWGAQNRKGGGELTTIARSELFTTLCGLGAALLLAQLQPALLWWLAPVWLPWALAIPLVLIASSERAGVLAKKLGLFLTPPETTPDELLVRAEELRALTGSDEAARFRDLVLDPVLLATHLARLQGKTTSQDEDALERAYQRALRVGPAALSDAERALLMASPEHMKKLHREAWRHWPVETWQLGRELAQLPPEPA